MGVQARNKIDSEEVGCGGNFMGQEYPVLGGRHTIMGPHVTFFYKV